METSNIADQKALGGLIQGNILMIVIIVIPGSKDLTARGDAMLGTRKSCSRPAAAPGTDIHVELWILIHLNVIILGIVRGEVVRRPGCRDGSACTMATNVSAPEKIKI